MESPVLVFFFVDATLVFEAKMYCQGITEKGGPFCHEKLFEYVLVRELKPGILHQYVAEVYAR